MATRVVAFDDGNFKPRTKGTAILIGVVYRTDHMVEGILSDSIGIDRLDSTEKIIHSVSKSRFYEQLSAVMLSGINFAGFNIADTEALNKKLKLPVIIVLRKRPDFKKIFSALKKFPDSGKRISLIKKSGKIRNCGKIFFQVKGASPEDAAILIRRCIIHSEMPEPIRLAHIIASGVSSGESKR